MGKLHKELFKGLKWVLIAILIIAFMVGAWVGLAWSIGWFVNRFFDLQNFSPESYISFGSIMLVFNLILQIITVIITVWALLAWGKSRGMNNLKGVK